MRKILTLAGMLMVTGLTAQPKLVDGIVAVVGRNIILKSAIDKQYASMKEQGLHSGADEADQCAVFEDLLFEKLMLHQAEIDSVIVSDEEVDMALERRVEVFAQQIGSRQKLEQYYKKSVVEIKAEMAPLVKNQMIAQRMMQTITADVEITPTEVRRFYNRIPEDSLPLINSQMEYAQIVKYPKPSEEAIREAIERLNELRGRVEEGSSFSTMAVLYSEDPGSAKGGGKYEGIKRGQFVKEFEAVAFNLKVNEISEPFKTEYGYHIVQLLARRGEELDLRHILIKPKISPENLQRTEAFLDSIRDRIRNEKTSFEEAAEQISDDENSKQNGGLVINPETGDSRWETGQLDKSAFYALEKMKPGDLSEPVFFREQDGQEGYRLVKLLSKTDPHRANLKTDYQQIQEMALQEKRAKAIQEWVAEKLKTTYVRVNNDYLNCEFDNDWIKKSQYVE